MQYIHTPPSLAELKAARKPLKKVTRRETRSSFTAMERFALAITHTVGSAGFFLILLVWTAGWLLWNTLGPIGYRFDPAPAFVIWLFVSNVVQLILLPLVMIGQNLEGKVADHRAEADYEVNVKAELEIETILAHLENQNELLLELTRKIDRR